MSNFKEDKMKNIEDTRLQNRFKLYDQRKHVEAIEDWRNVALNVPYLRFPESVEVSIVPPWGGIMTRFLVRLINNPKRYVSVYYDTLDRNSIKGYPYFEISPGVNNEPIQFDFDETEDMMISIMDSLNQMSKKST